MTESLTEVQQPVIEKRGPKWGRIFAWGGLMLLLGLVAVNLFKSQQGRWLLDRKSPILS
jgi:hypothetical protein